MAMALLLWSEFSLVTSPAVKFCVVILRIPGRRFCSTMYTLLLQCTVFDVTSVQCSALASTLF